MAVFRVEKNHNYTVMSNYHLRDTLLTLKAIGLLSKMLSLAVPGRHHLHAGMLKAETNKTGGILICVSF